MLGRITTMDAMTNGRYVIGFARGLARKEFEVFGVPMDESRTRFDEMAAMLVKGLETGVIQGDGPHFPTPATEIRPLPSVSLKDRLYCVAMSPDLGEADRDARLPDDDLRSVRHGKSTWATSTSSATSSAGTTARSRARRCW
ncbi:LLM class flavin-dependent oxidoreductase [Novosphingobium colocasiae]